ncbi:MAG: EAL domain-containing protein [Clostridiales bacterium]|jgi:EAL domain-containing protein (putative c-di-GMP-specific phosphodiesterase class I)/GGDEF domain-containing protein|nr:EAL domain-containing protein [Clostridiales bacterium]
MGHYKQKSYITAALVVVLVVAIAFLFGILNSNTALDSFAASTDIVLQKIESELDRFADGLLAAAETLDDRDIHTVPDGLLGAGRFTRTQGGEGAAAYFDTLFLDADGTGDGSGDERAAQAVSLTPFMQTHIAAGDSLIVEIGAGLFVDRDVDAGGAGATYFFASRRVAEDADDYVFVIADTRGFFDALPDYDFTDVYLLDAEGKLVTAKSGVSPRPFALGFSERTDVRSRFVSGEAFSFRGHFLEADSFFVLLAAPESAASVRVCGVLPQDTVNRFTNSFTLQMILVSVSMVLICLAGLVFLNRSYRNQYDVLVRTRTPINYYEVKVNRHGEILSAGKSFKENFDVAELNTHLINDAIKLNKEIADSQPIFVKLDGKDGNEYYLNFIPFRTATGFKLIGGNSSRFLRDYHEFKQKKQIDPYTNLPVRDELEKEIERVMDEGNGIRCMIGKITPANTEKISVMLGEYLYQQLIVQYSRHIESVLKKYGKLFSLGSQGFMFYTDDMDRANELINVIQEIMKQLSEVIKINDNIINVDSCCGFVVLDARNNDVNMDNIIYNCEIALKNATDNKKTRYYILRNFKYDGQHTDFTAKGLVLKMIENGEFEMYYQPQYRLKDMRLSGFEGLLRIVSERRKEIGIDKLISIAEQYGGMVELGRFVYESAMAFAKEIQGSGIEIAINVSAVQLMQIGFTEYFLEAYREKKLDRGSFNIEITEGTMVHSFDEVAAKLNILKENGVGTHIDDFGVAYSSMLYLQRLPVSVVKIDKSLVDEIVGSKGNAIITQGIINIAKNLDMKCIAEGVESREQIELLEQMNCDYIQGFLMSKALNHDQALELVKERK